VSTLQRRKEEGGWGKIDVVVKCRAMVFASLWAKSHSKGSASAE
jgi:hypothetical protein